MSDFKRYGEASLYNSPANELGSSPKIGQGRGQAWQHHGGIPFDDDDIYALVTNPTPQNIQLFDQKYGAGEAQQTLEADANGYDFGYEAEITMQRGPLQPSQPNPGRARFFDNQEILMNPTDGNLGGHEQSYGLRQTNGVMRSGSPDFRSPTSPWPQPTYENAFSAANRFDHRRK